MSLYKMILVDDEEDVRLSIARKVDWRALGFEMVGSVSNGEDALELAEQTHLDVVMTDIKMPFMDGLTLCKKLKENYKNTKVVLYSGFDEFELAREAVHLEAEEYLLKPIGAKDLENVFSKIKKNLDLEFNERRNLENLHEYYQKSLPKMREQLLTGILEGRIPEEQAYTMIHSYEMDFFSPYYAVVVIRTNFDSGKDLQKEQMIALSLTKLAQEYLENNVKSYTFMYLDSIVVIAQLQNRQQIQELVYHMNQICKMGNRMLEVKVAAGVGQAYSGLSKIAVSYQEANDALDYRVIVKEDTLALYINDVEPKSKTDFLPESQGLESLIHSIKIGTKEELEQNIQNYVQEVQAEMVAVQQYQLVFMETLTEVLKLMRSHQLDTAEVFGKNFEPYEELRKFQSMEDFVSWMHEKCNRIHRLISQRRTDTTNTLTEKAKQYIESNYSDSRLSVERLCNHLNVSATYFSTIFKKEVGMSFVSYVTKVRLEHAVELLNHTEDKSYMIAEKVGYTEANYFSYVFKKQYGVSPSKYRTKKETQEKH